MDDPADRKISISVPYHDDRDGNKSRPWCVRIAIPNRQTLRPLWRGGLVIRSGNAENATTIHEFLLQEQAALDEADLLSTVAEIQQGMNVIARRISERAHAAEQSGDAAA